MIKLKFKFNYELDDENHNCSLYLTPKSRKNIYLEKKNDR